MAHDEPVFGYQFTTEYLDTSSANPNNQGQDLLSEMEAQGLTDFFSHTAWDGPSAFPPDAGAGDALGTLDWAYGPPPPTIHGVSTTIPNQTALHEYPSFDPNLVSPHSAHFASTADDFQAANTLYNNAHSNAHNNAHNSAHMGPPASQPHGYHAPPATSAGLNGETSSVFHGAMVPTANGLLPEQLAALIPRHHAEGSVDASIAAQWARQSAQQQHAAQFRELVPPRPALKRTYTYGTDSAFGESGFQVSNKHETEDFVVDRLLNDMHHAQTHPSLANGHAKMEADDEDDDDDEEEDDDTDERVPKRRRSRAGAGKLPRGANGSRKGSTGKNRKASTDDRVSKKKRGSVTAHKPQRENLTEEQKRENHILSEQKRRNLIKGGFEDLNALVPELRNGGLSKSSVLNEAASYLESLIADNKRYEELMASAVG